MPSNGATQERILRAALKQFADAGYAGTSVQHIVDAARVTKPVLYYYFRNKAALFQALIDMAHDGRFHSMQKAAAGKAPLRQKLVGVVAASFRFMQKHRELTRLALITLFASEGEIPSEIRYLEKCQRNFEFLHSLVKQGQAEGALTTAYRSRELTMALFGMMNVYVMGHVVRPGRSLNQRIARRIVDLFLDGASGNKHKEF